MSTTIKSAYGHSNKTVSVELGTRFVHFEVSNPSEQEATISVEVPALLDAIRTELGVIVIDKADLPEVHLGEGVVTFDYGDVGHTERIPTNLDPDELIALGLALKTNPPIDPVKVKALADLLRTAVGVTPETTAAGHLVPADSTEIATRLLATGRIDVKEPS